MRVPFFKYFVDRVSNRIFLLTIQSIMKRNIFSILCFLFSLGLCAQNNGLIFNGDNENLVVPHKPEFNLQNNFTVEAWILASEWKPELWRGSIINKDGPNPDSGWALRCGDNGVLSFVGNVDGTWLEVFTTPIMNANQWHHVAAVIENGNVSLYLDGQPVISKTYSGTLIGNELDLHIGASAGFGERHFDGVIDEIRIWNTSRSGSEIADNTTTAFTGTEDGLVAYFNFDEGMGTTAINLVDPACSASFSNMDESNWVDGYTIPEFDVTPSRISGLDIINLADRPIALSVDLQNIGQNTLTEIPMEVYVDGNKVLEESYTGDLASTELTTFTFFTPIDLTSFTNPEIEVRTVMDNDGNGLNNSTFTKVVSANGNLIRIFDQVQHSFGGEGRTHNSSVILPADMSVYETLLLHISVDCPTTGCDPWDQTAKLEAFTEKGNFEIARYITPYGKACGPWTVDITDFKNILQGEVDFRSFIQVWGNSGWLVTMDLELIEGTIDRPYSKISPLWETDYHVYGDPGIDDNLDVQTILTEPNSEASHIRMTISGHGQGNTMNAAEFSNFTHNFIENGNNINAHNVWKDDCAFNPCDNQAGTWTFNRAGWCPGQEVQPYIVNTSENAIAGASVEFDYELQDYTNLLNTGYNGGSHTEPHYRIFSYFVESSSTRYEEYFNVAVNSIEAEISGLATDQQLDKLTMNITNTGSQPLSNIVVSYFINNTFIIEEDFNGTLDVGETATHEFQTLMGFEPNMYNNIFGVVSQQEDEYGGDDIAKTEVNPELNTSVEVIENHDIKIYPNPSQGERIKIDFGVLSFEGKMSIYDQSGKLVKEQQIAGSTSSFNMEQSGLYFITFTGTDGQQVTKKLIVHPY